MKLRLRAKDLIQATRARWFWFRHSSRWDKLHRPIRILVTLVCVVVAVLLIRGLGPRVLEWSEGNPGGATLISSMIVGAVTLAYVLLTRSMASTMREELELRRRLWPMVESNWWYEPPEETDSVGHVSRPPERKCEGQMCVTVTVWNWSDFPIWIQLVELRVEWHSDGAREPSAERELGQHFQLRPQGGERRLTTILIAPSDLGPDRQLLPQEDLIRGRVRVYYSLDQNASPDEWKKQDWPLEHHPPEDDPGEPPES